LDHARRTRTHGGRAEGRQAAKKRATAAEGEKKNTVVHPSYVPRSTEKYGEPLLFTGISCLPRMDIKCALAATGPAAIASSGL